MSQFRRLVPVETDRRSHPKSSPREALDKELHRDLCPRVLKPPASFALGPPGMQHRSQGSREIINKATHLQEPVSSTTWWDTEAEEGERPEGEEERDAEKDSSVTYHNSTVFSTGNQRGR